jgi:hypothetical protein
MSEPTEQIRSQRSTSLSIIAIINGLGLLITILFWGMVYFKRLVQAPGDLTDVAERANAATTYGFMIGDIIWSAPLLLLAAIGLWRQRFWGWTAAQMVNILWVYSMTLVWTRDSYSTISPGAMIFLPFTVAAVWATYYLWKHRELFLIADQR